MQAMRRASQATDWLGRAACTAVHAAAAVIFCHSAGNRLMQTLNITLLRR